MNPVDVFKQKFENAVATLESNSSVEVVPVVVKCSSTYTAQRLLVAFAVSFVTLALFSYRGDLWMSRQWEVVISLGLGVAVYGLTYLSFLFRWLMPSDVLDEECAEAASLSFLSNEVFATKARTGILVHVSLLERRVTVLADKAFASWKAEEWQKLGSSLAQDFKQGRPGDRFFEILLSYQDRFAKEFPRNTNDVNELLDGVRNQ